MVENVEKKEKKVKITLLVPETVLDYLVKRFHSIELMNDHITELVRADRDRPERNTLLYRRYRQKVIELSNSGKELTSETLADYAKCPIQVARDWLAKLEKYGILELAKIGPKNKKIYRLKNTSE